MRAIVDILEGFVSGTKHYDTGATKELLSSIFGHAGGHNGKQSDEEKNLWKETLARFEAKHIVYIRHAESPINVWVQANPIKFMLSLYPHDPALYNPGITDEGIKQCSQLKKMLEISPIKFEGVFISPFRRTIATYESILESKEKIFENQGKTLNPLACTLIRERASIPASVVGYSRSELIEMIPFLDCRLVGAENWWRYQHRDQQRNLSNPHYSREDQFLKREDDDALIMRVLLFLIYLAWRNENSILFFSHCSVYEAIKLFRTPKPRNAVPLQITSLDLTSLYSHVYRIKANL